MKSNNIERRTILYLTEIVESIEKSETCTKGSGISTVMLN